MHTELLLAAHRVVDSMNVGQLLPQVLHQVMEVMQQNADWFLLLLHSPTLTWHRAGTGVNGCSLQLAVIARSGLPCRCCICKWCCTWGQQVLAPLGTVRCLHGGQVNGLVPLQDLQEGAIRLQRQGQQSNAMGHLDRTKCCCILLLRVLLYL